MLSTTSQTGYGYKRYLFWSFISNVAVSAQACLATHKMLSVLGKASSKVAMTSNYVGKDIVGQLLGMYFVNYLGKGADKHPRHFSQQNMKLQQISLAIESSTPLFGLRFFIPVAGGANILKNISFAGFGSVNAMVIQKLAVSNNIGELYSQVTAVNTVGSTLGMFLGLGAAKYLQKKGFIGLFVGLGAVRIYSFNRSIENFF